MADGSLAPECFRVYMLQDYLYLHDYIDILKRILGYAENSGLEDFLNSVIRETENELYRMHIPSMKRIGIDDEEIRNCAVMPEFRNYIDYMREQLDDKGLLANQNWIDVLDAKTADISGEAAEDLADIFVTCARYENSLWDAL